jgi:hypothetical protein
MTSGWARLPVIITVSLIVAACAVEAAAAEPTLVEVWCGGDDGLTIKLRDALENAFRSSPDFSPSSGKKPKTLIVSIPTNVDWKQVGRRTRVLYTVTFSSADNEKLGASSGSCWDNAFAKCAAQIVKDAKISARKIHQARFENRD